MSFILQKPCNLMMKVEGIGGILKRKIGKERIGSICHRREREGKTGVQGNIQTQGGSIRIQFIQPH